MVKKNKELDEQYKYFARKISNQIADIGMVFGLLLSLGCFIVAMIGYYMLPEGDQLYSLVFIEHLFGGIYATVQFITEGLGNYITSLPEFVNYCFLGIIVGIVICFLSIALFWEELEEEKPSDSEIWNDIKKEKPDGKRIYLWKIKVLTSTPIDDDVKSHLKIEFGNVVSDWGYSTSIEHEELTNEVPE